MVDMIVSMNLKTTIHYQKNKCLGCGAELPTEGDEEVYFIMDQKEDNYEVYCGPCGHKKEVEK